MASFKCAENLGYIIEGGIDEYNVDRAVEVFVKGAQASVELCRRRGGNGPNNPDCAACYVSRLTPDQLLRLINNLKNGEMRQIPSSGHSLHTLKV